MSNQSRSVTWLRGLLLLSPAVWLCQAIQAQACECQAGAARSEPRVGELSLPKGAGESPALALQATPTVWTSFAAPEGVGSWTNLADLILVAPGQAQASHPELVQGERGFIGVTLDVEDDSITISGIVDGSNAGASGLQAGDRIIRVAGQEIHSFEDIGRALDGNGPETTIFVQIERDGSQQALPVKLSRIPGTSAQDLPMARTQAAPHVLAEPREPAPGHVFLDSQGEEMRAWSGRFEQRLQELRADLEHRSKSLQQSIDELRERARPLADDARVDVERLRAEAQRWREERARDLDDLQHRHHESMERLHRRLLPPLADDGSGRAAPDAPATPRSVLHGRGVGSEGDAGRVRVESTDGETATIVLDGKEIHTIRIPRSSDGSQEVIVLEGGDGQPMRIETRAKASASDATGEEGEHDVLLFQGEDGMTTRLDNRDGTWTWHSMEGAQVPSVAPRGRTDGGGDASAAGDSIRRELDELRGEVGKLAGELRALRELLEQERRGTR